MLVMMWNKGEHSSTAGTLLYNIVAPQKDGSHSTSRCSYITLPSVIALNINGLNFPNRGHRLVEWSKKQNPNFLLLIKTLLTFKDRYNLRPKVWKNYFKQMEPVKFHKKSTIGLDRLTATQ